MAYYTFAFFLLFSSSHLFVRPTRSNILPSVPIDRSTPCNLTLDPDFCNIVLPHRGFHNLYDYGRLSLAKSLSTAKEMLDSINTFLARPSVLPPNAILALQDCRLLSGLNVDFLTAVVNVLNDTDCLLDHQAQKVHAILSAILTNHQTCYDGLQVAASAWFVRNLGTVPLSVCSKIYGLSLSLFKNWIPKQTCSSHKGQAHSRSPHRRALLFHEVGVGRHGELPLRMSAPKRELFERWSGRRLLQATDSVLVHDVVVVSPDGSGNFTTIGDAVNSAPNNLKSSNGYHLIYVAAGVYQEYVVIPNHTTYLMMIGEGINQTVITGNHSVADGWTTFHSSTFAVMGEGFVAMNITFRNTAGPIKHQAVAVLNGADLSTFYGCSIEGYQDTLYTLSMRQFYRDCDIYGTVDYIFGNAAVAFQSCNVYSRLPLHRQSNAITAQGRTDPNQNTGTSMQFCRFLAAGDLTSSDGTTKTYLGRPWKKYSRTVIMESFMDSLIDPAGWVPWNGKFALDTLYYAEYNNTGKGSDTDNRVTWPGYHVISSDDAMNFTVRNFIQGDNWLPHTGVAYDSGLF
ncbi:unnamed protein product [Musa hybrid cultivar]